MKVKNIMPVCLLSQTIVIIESDYVNTNKERLFEGENDELYQNIESLNLSNRKVHTIVAKDNVLYVFVEKE